MMTGGRGRQGGTAAEREGPSQCRLWPRFRQINCCAVPPGLGRWAPTLENMLLRNVLLELNLKDGTRAESM